MQTCRIFLCSRCLESGTRGHPQQRQCIFQLNSVTSDRVTPQIFLGVVGTVSLLRFSSLVIVFWHAQ